MPDDYYVSQYSGEEIDDLLGKAGSATGAVRYDAAQSLTDEQKAQARTNINAAPGGFGLGANGYPYPYTVLTGDTIDTINRSGLYAYDDDNVSIDAGLNPHGKGGLLLHLAHTIAHSFDAKQIFYPRAPMGNAYLSRVKDTDKGWQPWEWVNPPMQLGVEYRTTERYLGKPVYVKLVDFGALPNNTAKGVVIASNMDSVISIEVIVYSPESLKGAYFTGASGITNVSAVPNNNNVWINTDQDYSSTAVYCFCKYTKTTN